MIRHRVHVATNGNGYYTVYSVALTGTQRNLAETCPDWKLRNVKEAMSHRLFGKRVRGYAAALAILAAKRDCEERERELRLFNARRTHLVYPEDLTEDQLALLTAADYCEENGVERAPWEGEYSPLLPYVATILDSLLAPYTVRETEDAPSKTIDFAAEEDAL